MKKPKPAEAHRHSRVESGSRNSAPSPRLASPRDFDLWAKHDLWTYEEAICLAMGQVPSDGYEAVGVRAGELRELVRVALLVGAFDDDDGELTFDRRQHVRPLFFIGWCKKKGIQISAGLRTVFAPAPAGRPKGSGAYAKADAAFYPEIAVLKKDLATNSHDAVARWLDDESNAKRVLGQPANFQRRLYDGFRLWEKSRQ